MFYAYTNLPTSKYWNRNETRFNLFLFLVSSAMLYAARTTMPICSSAMAFDFGWSKTQMGIGLSSFFWGYTTTQVLGGYFADRIGGDVLIIRTAICWSTIMLLAPTFINLTEQLNALFAAILVQVSVGCFQGVYFASIASLFSRRISPSERAFSFSVACSGIHFGTLLSGAAGSLLLEKFGWEIVYHFIGGFSVLWFLVFRLKTIDSTAFKNVEISDEKVKLEIPKLEWCALIKKAPFWSIIIGQFCYSWAFFILLSWLPTFFKEKFPHERSWMYNVIPWSLSLPVQWIGGWTADRMVMKGFTTNFVRKFFQSIAFIGVGTFLLLISLTNDFITCLALTTAAITCCTCQHSGIAVNVQDIAPDHAGILFGLMNLAGSIPGFIGVYTTGYILDVTKSWAIVFNFTSLLCYCGCAIYLTFGTASRII